MSASHLLGLQVRANGPSLDKIEQESKNYLIALELDQGLQVLVECYQIEEFSEIICIWQWHQFLTNSHVFLVLC